MRGLNPIHSQCTPEKCCFREGVSNNAGRDMGCSRSLFHARVRPWAVAALCNQSTGSTLPCNRGDSQDQLRPQTGRYFGTLLPLPKYIWASGDQAGAGTPQDKWLRFLMGLKLVWNQRRWDPLIQCRLTFLRGSQEKQAAIQKVTEEQRREVGEERGNGKKHEATSSIHVSNRGLPCKH